jgi:hypothetical protein
MYGQRFSFLTNPARTRFRPMYANFSAQALIVTKPMIEKVTLPFYKRAKAIGSIASTWMNDL